MAYPPIIETRVYAGPSLLSEHPVVSLTIPTSVDARIKTSVVDTLLGSTSVGHITRSMSSHSGHLMCSQVTHALTQALLAASGTPELSVDIHRGFEHQLVIVARYYDPVASLTALQTSFNIASELSRNGESLKNSGQQITGFVTQKIRELSYYSPDELAHSLIRKAEISNIPVRVFASASRVWLFGQGVESVQFFEAITSSNGLPGVILAKNKAHTNKVVNALGFPSPRWGLARELGPAKDIAKTLGYPVVVKPVDGGKGQGVTADITRDAEFEMAFKKAAATTTSTVLIENYIVGDDHRIAVFDGRFAWATKRMPAKVIGDGKQSIQELISQENTRREQLGELQFDLKSIVVDDELVRVLRKQCFSLYDCPLENTSVLLSSVANISTGGTREDCTSIIHPDNVVMAECVARSFRLDTVGIDFITPDIRKSWRECVCAIIEINGAPGFSTHENAKLILERKFVGESDGRIPIILALNCATAIHDRLVSKLGANREGVGYVNADTCKVDNHVRGDSLIQISDKVNALLSDPACSSLVIGLTTRDIEVSGLPVDRCTVSLFSKKYDVPEQIKNIIEAASGRVLEISHIDDFKHERFRNVFSKLNGA